MRRDESGAAWETVFDVISLGASITDVVANPANAWAWIGLAGDIANVAIPFIGGIGETIKCCGAVNKADNIIDVAKKTSYGKSSGNYSGADNIADAARLKEYYKQAEKYGTGSIKELSNGRFRFYEELKLTRTKGEMAGARHVREWDSYTGYKRDWYETLDHNGNIRQVRPDPNITGGVKVHYMFDVDGNYIGNWVPNK